MIGEALKAFRNIHGYKAKEIAEMLRISPSYLSEIENNKKDPTLELLKRYSIIFDIKLSTLIQFSEEYDRNRLSGKAKNSVRSVLFKFLKRLESENSNE